MVSTLSIICMAIAGIISVVLPIALFMYLRRWKKADAPPFFIGFVVFVVFAMVLESLVHNVVLNGLPVGETIKNNIWLYAVYGGLAAGIFEETGRFIAFKTVMKRFGRKDENALMFGAGHGGIEAIMIVGYAMVSYIAISLMINNGTVSQLTESLTGDALTQVQASIDALITTPPYQFLLSAVERVSALVLHMSLSVLVWFAAFREKKISLFITAILLHASVDGVTAVLQSTNMNIAVLEIIILIMAICVAACAKKVWNENHVEQTPPAPTITE